VVNPLLLSVMGGTAAAHSATALYDVALATEKREVRPIEQHIHSFPEVLPLSGITSTGYLYADEVRAALRGGRGPDDWKLLPRDWPLSAAYLAGLDVVTGAGVVLPYAEELRRCSRAQRSS
jgi:hypothetical protein